MDVPAKIADIQIQRDQVIITIEYVFQGLVESQSANFPASRFKGMALADVQAALLEVFKGIVKTRIDSATEITGGAWVNAANFIGKQFTIVV